MIQFNKKEALRYFRAQPGDAQAEAAGRCFVLNRGG